MTTPQKITPLTEFKLDHQYIFCKQENNTWDGIFVIYKENSEEGPDKNVFFRSYVYSGCPISATVSLRIMLSEYTHYIALNENA